MEGLAQQQAALRARRRALLLQMELASGLERCERAQAADADALASGRELAQPADAERARAARELERVAEQVHRLGTIAELDGLAEAGADAQDRLAAARRVAGARALESALWAVRASNGAVLAHCLRAVEALDAGAELVAHVRERLVRPRAAQIARDTGGLPTVGACVLALEEAVRTHLAALVPAVHVRQTGAGGGVGALARALAPFRLVAHAVWPELLDQLVLGRPGLFAVGQPAAFHAHFCAAQRLTAAIEALCADGAELAELRAHPASAAFCTRWALRPYFELRLAEICAQLEAGLQAGAERAEAEVDAGAQRAEVAAAAARARAPALQLRASAAIARALLACVSPDVLLRPLAARFARLAMQMPPRLASWAAHALAPADAPAAAEALEAGGEGGGAPGAAEPAAARASADLVLLGGALCADTLALAAWLRGEYAQLLVGALGLDEPAAEARGLAARARQCVRDAASRLEAAVLPLARAALCAELERRCAERLAGVRGIGAAYRFQAKELPAQPSAFMREALEPLQSFAHGADGGGVPAADKQAVLEACLGAVGAHYARLVAELAQTTLRTESSIKRLQPRRQQGAAAEGGEAGSAPSDSDKIFAQLRIDAASFRAQAARLVPEPSWPAALADALHQLDLSTVQSGTS